MIQYFDVWNWIRILSLIMAFGLTIGFSFELGSKIGMKIFLMIFSTHRNHRHISRDYDPPHLVIYQGIRARLFNHPVALSEEELLGYIDQFQELEKGDITGEKDGFG